MKKLLPLFLICVSFSAIGQKVDFSLIAGTGKSYLFESIDKSVSVHYGLPLSLLTEIKYTPKGTSWGIKLRLHSVESTVKGENWVNSALLNGYINTLTTSVLLEKEFAAKTHAYGFNFGWGLTKETIQPRQIDPANRQINNYATITVGGHWSYSLSRDFDFQILPILLWQDPFKSIGALTGSRKANFADEDLTMLVNVGIRYRFIQ